MNQLLLIEDDSQFRYVLKEQLADAGFAVLEAATGEQALACLRDETVDLILLDLGLPDCCGLSCLPKIREYTNAPVIVVSGQQALNTRVEALEQGADDFVLKPFSMKELIARVRANLSRYQQYNASREAVVDMIVKTDRWTLDRARFQLLDREGQSLQLTALEFQLFDMLVRCAGQALRRSELCEAVREDNYVPTPRAIDIKIARIRKKIGDDANQPTIIKTVRGVGYMLDVEAG